MKDVSDVIGWVVGGLAAIGFFNYRSRLTSDNDKFKALFDSQRESQSTLASHAAKIEGIQTHFLQALEDIKAQNSEMAKDVTAIKVGLASIPKRQGDS